MNMHVVSAAVKHGRDVIVVYECCRHHQHCKGELFVRPVNNYRYLQVYTPGVYSFIWAGSIVVLVINTCYLSVVGIM